MLTIIEKQVAKQSMDKVLDVLGKDIAHMSVIAEKEHDVPVKKVAEILAIALSVLLSQHKIILVKKTR